MAIYTWLSTHGSYKGLLMLLENDVSVHMGTIYDMVLTVRIYEKNMGAIIMKHYDTMA